MIYLEALFWLFLGSLLGFIYHALRPRVSRERAIEIAKSECEKRGWPWKEPVSVTRSLVGYEVFTNSKLLGQNATIWVDGRTGAVIKADYLK